VFISLLNGAVHTQETLSNSEEAGSKLVSYITLYYTAKMCAENGLSFSSEQIIGMEQFIRTLVDSSGINQDQKDHLWNLVQTQLPTQQLTERGCLDALNQTRYMFPPDVVSPQGVPVSPRVIPESSF
jgi:hypothetical protein